MATGESVDIDRTPAEHSAHEASAEVRRLYSEKAPDRLIAQAIERRDLAWAAVRRESENGR